MTDSEAVDEMKQLQKFYATELKASKAKQRSWTRGAWVYYVLSNDQYVKIGSAKNPISRLAGLQTSSPYKLRILYIEPDRKSRAVERARHREFAALRVNGEWFKYEGALKAFLFVHASEANDLISSLDQ